ncbi:MAG: hypothetical protein WCB96_10420 [Candidatus Aminicenantales bacterium]
MPILHRYQDKSGWFVRTSIENLIITFQLTAAGARRLLEAGIKDGSKFRRAILFELSRSGDAFTHGTGPGRIEPHRKGQLGLDLSNDPEPATIFPRCSLCGSFDDLHLVEIRQESRHYAAIECPRCRKKGGPNIDTSIPLRFVTRSVFGQVLDLKGIKDIDNNASVYGTFMEKAFNEMWDKLTEKKIKGKKARQGMLFDANGKQKKLL